MAQINKDMIIHDIIQIDTDIIPILLDAGMHWDAHRHRENLLRKHVWYMVSMQMR